LQIQCDPGGVEYKVLTKYELINIVATVANLLAEDELEKIVSLHG